MPLFDCLVSVSPCHSTNVRKVEALLELIMHFLSSQGRVKLACHSDVRTKTHLVQCVLSFFLSPFLNVFLLCHMVPLSKTSHTGAIVSFFLDFLSDSTIHLKVPCHSEWKIPDSIFYQESLFWISGSHAYILSTLTCIISLYLFVWSTNY